MSKGKKLLLIAPLAIAGLILFTWIGGQLVMRLWNWLLPDLFGFHTITFWQALGLLVLCRILFGGFGGHRSGNSRMRQRIHQRMEERRAARWDAMTPEEREKLRERFRGRWGACDPQDPEALR